MPNDVPGGATPPDRVWAQPTMPGSRLAPGMDLGRFRVEELIARGGMGEVWKAYDPARQRPVVVKVLPAQFQGNPQEIARIQQSFQRINALQHQHICPVYDLGEDPRCGHYLVMKYVEGETLAVYRWKYVQQHGTFPLGEVDRVLRPIAAALDYAHGQKVIHRDIKPQNILVRADGSEPQLVDFGLAAEIRESASRVSMTQTDTSGTYPYMAPEQWRGQRQDSKADQYSLAVVAYELLCGDPPFAAPDTNVLRLCVLQEPVPPIGEQPPQVNAALGKAMAKNPQERFASCGEFIGALGGAASTPPASAGAAGSAARGSSSRRAARPPASIAGPTYSQTPSTGAREGVAGQASSSSGSSKITLVLLAVVVIGGVVFWKDLFGKKAAAPPAPTAAPVASSPPAPGVSSPGPGAGVQLVQSGPAAAPQPPVPGAVGGQPTATPASSTTALPPAASSPGGAMGNAAAPTRPSAPPPGNPVEEREAAMAQLAANQAKGEATGCDAEHIAPTEWNAAQLTMAAAEKQFADYRFPLARGTYQQAAQQYRAARVAAEKVFAVKMQAEAAQREMSDARDAAAAVQAQTLSATLWGQAEQMQGIGEAELRDSRFESARDKLAAAAEAYHKAKEEAVQLDRAVQAREKFSTEVANPGREKLDKYGGSAWTAAMKAIAESEAAKDPRRIADSYEQALNLLPDARELAMEPNPDAPASTYRMELSETDKGKLPAGWRGAEGADSPNILAVTMSDGALVLMNQANTRPAAIESPPLRLNGDFFLQFDTLWCPKLSGLEIALVGGRAGRELVFRVGQQATWVQLSLPGAAPREAKVGPGGCPVSYRLERRDTAYTLCITTNTSEIVAVKLPHATVFRSIRLTFNNNGMRVTGLRAGPLGSTAAAAATVPFSLETLPGPTGTDRPSGEGHRILVPGLNIDKDFAVEFSVLPIHRCSFYCRLIGRDGAADFPMVFSNGHWSWAAAFPEGYVRSAKIPQGSTNSRFRIERSGTMYRVTVNGQEFGRQQVLKGLGGFEAIELIDLNGSAQASSLRVEPLQ